MTAESPRWFKSSYSDNGGACVEVAGNLVASRGVVPVRDSKVTQGPALVFESTAWSSFVASLRCGDLSA